MKNATEKINSSKPLNNDDIQADEDVLEFIRVIANVTANAKPKNDGEKFIALGRNSNDEVVVQSIGILSGSGAGGTFSILSNTIAIAHVHYKDVREQNRPGPGDHDSLKKMGISNFMINKSGSKVFEVGRQKAIDGKYHYRTILGGSDMNWRHFKGAE